MAFIVRRSERTVQPAGPVEVDWNNPLTDGLRVFSTPTSTTHPLIFGPRYQEIVGMEGAAFGFTGVQSAGRAAYYENPADVGVSGNASIFLMYRRFTGPSGNPAVYAEGTAGGYFRNAFIYNGSAWVWRTRDIQTGDTGASREMAVQSVVAGAIETRLFTIGGAGPKTAYVNGRFDRTDATGAPFTATPATELSFSGFEGSTAYHNDSRLYIYAMFDRALSADRARELHDNPWQLLKPVQRRMYFMGSAGAPLSSFWANVGGTPTRALGLRAWNGASVVTPTSKRWNGAAWEEFQ